MWGIKTNAQVSNSTGRSADLEDWMFYSWKSSREGQNTTCQGGHVNLAA